MGFPEADMIQKVQTHKNIVQVYPKRFEFFCQSFLRFSVALLGACNGGQLRLGLLDAACEFLALCSRRARKQVSTTRKSKMCCSLWVVRTKELDAVTAAGTDMVSHRRTSTNLCSSLSPVARSSSRRTT